jgi:hypothetical protein
MMDDSIFADDRVPILGGFLRTCDSMMSGFESLYDGIECGQADTDTNALNIVGHVPTLELWMNDDPMLMQ